ncbi:MAG: sialidase family protein [Planctomycetia bacterium]|nr:sialidase family protein [Planctomycetia bacterium]
MKTITKIICCVLFLLSGTINAQENDICLGKENIPTIDLSQEQNRHTIIAQGTSEIYQGHPYSVMFPDKKTIFVAWNINHGGNAGPMAKSVDGGLSWQRLDNKMPPEYFEHINCPSIFRLVNQEGNEFLWVFTSQPMFSRIVSEDKGETWTEQESLGFPNVMAFSSIVPKNPGIQDGKYIGFFHRRVANNGEILNKEPNVPGSLQVVISETNDAGWTWSEPRTIAALPGKDLCEPFAFWSPNQKEICCLMRENQHKGCSMVSFSNDKGETWSLPTETSWGLTGDRHIGTYLPDGRLFFAFRDQAHNSSTRGHFVGWVGTYDDIKNRKTGQYRIKLLHSFAGSDCGYPGVHLLSDGTIIALTYIKYKNDNQKHSVVLTRFKICETDDLFKNN